MSKPEADFEAILNVQMDNIEKPKPIPQGRYHAVVKTYKFITSKEKNTPGAEVTFRLVRPIETEDDELANSMDFSEKEFRTTYWLSKDAQFRAKEFLEAHLGIHSSGRNMGEVWKDCPNQECGVQIVHNPKKDDPSVIYANIKETFSLTAA